MLLLLRKSHVHNTDSRTVGAWQRESRADSLPFKCNSMFHLGSDNKPFYKKRTENEKTSLPRSKISLSDVTESINGTVKSLGVICGTILAFNVLLELLSCSGFLNALQKIGTDKIFRAALEISNLSMFRGSGYGMMPLFAAIASFGGFCIILQTAALSEGKIKLKKFMLSRIPAALLSAAYCFALTRICPIILETEAVTRPVPILSSVNPICSVCLIVMSFILLKSVKPAQHDN